ncbi:hypothetical protein BJ508DRAFT_305984 [Ascobolus immersus RN42]|uniref:Uncharacterized protein n=1 Tax=Ascobolus immersus RN42 TaxID=1160509 RepID=A0A3N4I9G0_ASCIM|nr:hypothetical protein BJ508DRAFT_305984 [Ascobolus immersus RN42]
MSSTSDKPATPLPATSAPPPNQPDSQPQNTNLFGTIRNYADQQFTSARQYADHQLTSILQSVFGLPSSNSAPNTSNWAVFDDKDGDATPTEEENLRRIAANRTRSVSSGILEEVQTKGAFERGNASGNGGLRVSSEIEAARRNSESGRR